MIHTLQSRQRLRMPLEGQTYCWWKNSGNHQLIGSYLQGFHTSQVVVSDFWTINCMLSMLHIYWHLQLGPYSPNRWSCAQFEINKLGVPEAMANWNENCMALVTQGDQSWDSDQGVGPASGENPEFFDRDAQVDVSGLLKRILSEMTKDVKLMGHKNCLKMNLQVMYTDTARHESNTLEGFALRPLWNLDVEGSIYDLIKPSLNLVWNWPKSAPCLAVWMIFTVFLPKDHSLLRRWNLAWLL